MIHDSVENIHWIMGKGIFHFQKLKKIMLLFFFISFSEASITLHSSEEYVIHGDSLLVGIYIDELVTPLSSINLDFTGFDDRMTVLGLELDEQSLMGSHGWIIEYNTSNGYLTTAAAGSDAIIDNGRLFSIEFLVHDTVSSQIIDVEINDYLGNEDLNEYNSYSGGIHVLWLPEPSFIADITTGSYPLEVTFQENSTAGTYPIIQWHWNFGNGYIDTGESVSTVYEIPGSYDVELMVIDELGLNNILFMEDFIQIDTTYGDVDFNTIVDITDAQMISDYIVGVSEFDVVSMGAADVTVNGTISSLDVAVIMLFIDGEILQLPHSPGVWFDATGNISIHNTDLELDDEIYLPVVLSEGSNIYGFTATLNFDPLALNVDSISISESVIDYAMTINEVESGIVNILGVGTEALGVSDTLFTIIANFNENYSGETNVSITELSWNEESPIEFAADVTLGPNLGFNDITHPNSYEISQNYPNPFNPYTSIKYSLPNVSDVNIYIYDLQGKMVRKLVDAVYPVGEHFVIWNGKDDSGRIVSTGIYTYVMRTGNFSQTKKMLFIK